MANLTSANVRVIAEWVEGELYSKRRIAKRVEVHGIATGGGTNRAVATAFGLRVIEEVTPAYNANSGKAMQPVPTGDGSAIGMFLALDNNTATADVTASATPLGLYFTVKGY